VKLLRRKWCSSAPNAARRVRRISSRTGTTRSAKPERQHDSPEWQAAIEAPRIGIMKYVATLGGELDGVLHQAFINPISFAKLKSVTKRLYIRFTLANGFLCVPYGGRSG
jgi:hypothetical protein